MGEYIGSFVSYRLIPLLLNMTLTGSVVILLVLLMRFLLRNAPKVFSYALWAVVLFRLLCPVALTAEFSALRWADPPARQAGDFATAVEYIPPRIVHDPAPAVDLPVPVVGDAVSGAVNDALPQGEEQTVADPLETPVAIAAAVWLLGALAMAGWGLVSLFRLRRRLVGAMRLEGNVYLADHIDTPFVLGLVRPKVYLPSALPEGERGYILMHERHHIHCGDHIVKAVAFIALCVHWFNPLVWVAFVLAGKDMEMRCDEAVLRKLGEDVRADYSASLLNLATGRRIIAGTPLAFGEGDTKSRVLNVLRWRRPRPWLVASSAFCVAALIAACGVNPAVKPTGRYESMEDFAQQAMAAETVNYTTPAFETATANVTDRRIAWLDKVGEVKDLDPDGVLEAWTFNYEVRLDVPAEQVMMAGGMYEIDGWFDLEGQGGHDIVALRYPDGSYDVLYDQPVNDNLNFYGYHNSYEEAIYDWYVTENGLDLPLFVEDWLDEIDLPEGASMGNYPVHRYDGDGWYLYVPVSGGWTQEPSLISAEQWRWVSGYGTGSALTVDRFTLSVEDEKTVSRKQNYTPVNDAETIWQSPEGNGFYYLFPAGDGGSWRVSIDWDEGRIARYPYTELEPQVLRLMAESFTMDARVSAPPLLTLEDVRALAEKGDALGWADFEHFRYTEGGSGLYIRTYPIDETYSLWIGGGWIDDPPMYIQLAAGEEFIDIRTEDVEAFLAAEHPVSPADAQPLTAEELEELNQWLYPMVYDRRGDLIGASPQSCFLTSFYADVRELDFAEFLRYFPASEDATAVEFDALKSLPDWAWAHIETLQDMPAPLHRYARELVDLILGEYAGISTADLDTSAVDYLPEFDAFYNYTSDFGPGSFVAERGERDGDLLRLYGASIYDSAQLTLRETGEGDYQFVSHLPVEEPARP